MNMQLIKNLNSIFYVILFLSGGVFLLPSDYKIVVYTPSIIGWFLLLVLIPILIITFFWLLIKDLREKNTKKLIIRFLVFLFVIGLCAIYWFSASPS